MGVKIVIFGMVIIVWDVRKHVLLVIVQHLAHCARRVTGVPFVNIHAYFATMKVVTET